MLWYPTARREVLAMVTAVAAMLTSVGGYGWARGATKPAQSAPKPPSWVAIQAAIEQHFSALPGYQPGGIISRADVEPLLTKLAEMGWSVPQPQALLARLPSPDEFLVRELRNPDGRKFAASISRFPGAFDCLDQLSRIPNGHQTVRRLIRGPDGYKLIQYLTTTSGGRELEKMLAAVPGGANFGRSTGRIYTSAMLTEHLRTAYAQSPTAGMSPGKRP